jgi:hypothetical protein
MILNKLKYKLEHKMESFCNELEDKATLTIIVQMAVKKKLYVSADLFKQLLFSLYWHIKVDMRANFWKAFNISLNMNYITC